MGNSDNPRVVNGVNLDQLFATIDQIKGNPEIAKFKLLGTNQGTNRVEYLLVALSGCLTTALVAHSSTKGIEIQGVHSRFEGDIDLRGFLGSSEDVPVGYQAIRVFFKIDADVSDAEKEEMVKMAKKYSPVFNTISRSAPVEVMLEKA